MTWRARVRLAVGLVVVVVVAAALTMLLNDRNGRVEGRSASLAAESFPVGTDYSGTVTAQLVQLGDTVVAGQPMFELESGALQRDLAQGLLERGAVPYEIRDDGVLVLVATDAGRVDSLTYAVGSFVPANSVIATVQRAGSLFVEAEFLLTPQDYGRLAPDAVLDVVLPSNQRVGATVGRVQVETVDGTARTRVVAYSPDLAAATADGLFAVGTPVSATLYLRNDGPVTDATEFLSGLVGGMRILLLVLAVLLAACSVAPPGPDAVDPVVVEPDVTVLPQRSVGDPPQMRLADGLVPPTNTWFAGLVFGPEPLPVFPLPLSVDVRDTGFTVGLPLVDATARTVFGSHTPAPDLDVGSAATRVVAYDALTVTTAFLADDGTERGRMLMARGSPYVRYTATAAHDVTVTAPELAERDGWWSSPIRETEWGFAGDLDTGGRASLAPGDGLTLWAVPPGGDAAELARSAAAAVTGGSATPGVDGDRVTTTLRWDTADGSSPLVAAMPYQGPEGCTAGVYRTAYGPMPLCRGPELTVSAPRLEPAGELDLSGLGDSERAEVAEQVGRDAATALDFTAGDTYFGGKQLARAATLMRLAEQLDLDDVAATLRAGVGDRLRRWTEPDGCTSRATTCFVYDPAVRGVVGLEASFGSEQFNDHQFHYGYLLYAAGVAARTDPELAADIAPVMDLLAADIASAPGGVAFPAHRSFDAYAGHSWASGFSPFGDGNNQESSSESVNAYNGLALWAQARGDDALRGRAEWMLAAEAASARLYWTDPPLASSEFDGFDHGVLGINWGGKRDYATWFSPEPSAMLGIQLIPMGPVSGYLAGDADRIRANVAEATPAGGFDVMFGDYLAMYLALADPAAARAALAELPEERIDDGNTRSYLLAWIYTR